MRALRRALLAVGVGSVVATILRLRAGSGVEPREGRWRELSGPELR